MADLLRNGDVAVKLGAFEQQALIHDFSTSASARFNATLNRLVGWFVNFHSSFSTYCTVS